MSSSFVNVQKEKASDDNLSLPVNCLSLMVTMGMELRNIFKEELTVLRV